MGMVFYLYLIDTTTKKYELEIDLGTLTYDEIIHLLSMTTNRVEQKVLKEYMDHEDSLYLFGNTYKFLDFIIQTFEHRYDIEHVEDIFEIRRKLSEHSDEVLSEYEFLCILKTKINFNRYILMVEGE